MALGLGALTWPGAAAEPAPEAPEVLIARLESRDRESRREASRTLGLIGPKATIAIPALLKALEDTDKQVVTNSLTAFANMGPAASSAIAPLIASLENRRQGRETDRQQIIMRTGYALAQMGPAALPALIDSLTSPNNQRRVGVTIALGNMGAAAGEPAATEMVKNLSQGDEELRRQTVDALGSIGAPAVKPLLGSLSAEQPKARAASAQALAQIGREAAESGPALLTLAQKDADVSVRAAALQALPRVGATGDDALQVLVAAARQDVPELRHGAVNGLLGLPQLAARATPLLVADLQKPDAAQRKETAVILGRFGPRAKAAIPNLIACAKADPEETAFSSALAQIGPAAMAPLLAELSSEKGTAADRQWIFWALGAMGAPAEAALRQALDSPVAAARAGAAAALAGMSLERSPAVKRLVELTADADPAVRAACFRALSGVRSQAGVMVPRLEAGLEDSDPQVRKACAFGLANLGATGKLGVNGLLDLLGEADVATQRVAMRGLGALGAGAAKAVPELMERAKNPEFRADAVEALGLIGPAAAPAVPALIDLAKAANDTDKVPLFQALCAIGTGAEAALPMFYDGAASQVRELRPLGLKGMVLFEKDGAKLMPYLLSALRTEQRRGRHEAQVGLKKFNAKPEVAVPLLVPLLDSDTDRPEVIETLRTIRPNSVPVLLGMLKHKDPLVRVLACESLGLLGPAAKDAIPALTERTNGDDDRVKQAARNALKKVAPDAAVQS